MARRLLLIDDDRSLRNLVRSHLEPEGWEVSEAGTASEALDAAQRCRPEAILLDVNLPDGEGFDVCRRLKADPAFSRVPVLMISGQRVAAQDKVEGLEGGAIDYLVKPFKLNVLSAKLEALLRA